MSVRSTAAAPWQRRALAGLAGLVLLTPLFGWAATKVGYAEPMENAAELADASARAVPTAVSLLSGYSIPGVGPHLGTLGAALFGTVLTLGLGIGLARLLAVED